VRGFPCPVLLLTLKSRVHLCELGFLHVISAPSQKCPANLTTACLLPANH
jgi:hypothetical protein